MFLDGLRHVLFICSGFLLVGSDRVGGEGKKELVLRYISKVEIEVQQYYRTRASRSCFKTNKIRHSKTSRKPFEYQLKTAQQK